MPTFSAKTGHPAYDARHLRRIFDRRAATFDHVAFLPREIAQRMHERLDYIKVQPARMLDAGCGPGDDFALLHQRFPDAPVFGVDISSAMLSRAAQQRLAMREGSGWRRWWALSMGKLSGAPRPRVVQADFSALPFASDAFGLVWSNLALHWHPWPERVFAQWQRVLQPNGLLMFSTLGPDTLKELRRAYAQAETACDAAPRAHIMDFADMHDLGDMLLASGFGAPVMDQETLTITYRSPTSLLADVRRWGAYPFVCDDDARSARRLHHALLQALQAQRRDDGTFALTFEIVYGHAWKVLPRVTPEGHGIVRVGEIGRGRWEDF